MAKEVIQAKRLGISPEELLNQSLKNVPEGCEGLLFQPYFTPNITMPTARGAIIGFSDAHTRIHLYRAIIEGINFALIDGMKVMEQRAGHKFQAIYLGGGGSQSDEICQITAHMFGLPVVRTQTYEATGIGCALAAFVGIGVFESYEDGVKAMVHEKDRFEPDEKFIRFMMSCIQMYTRRSMGSCHLFISGFMRFIIGNRNDEKHQRIYMVFRN